MEQMTAAVFESGGRPQDVLKLRKVARPRPRPNEVLVRVEARPMHPADFMFIANRYRIKPQWPQVAGLEGAGTVIESGAQANVAAGTRVAFRYPGTWADLVAVSVDRLFPVPASVPTHDAAQFSLNPVTAWGLLDEAGLESGDWLAMNAATSGIALILHGLARSRGISTIGVVRDLNETAHALPFPIVSSSSTDLASEVLRVTGEAPLAAYLDSVGGPGIKAMFPAMKQGAVVISYGVLGQAAVELSNPDMIYKNLTLEGIWRRLLAVSCGDQARKNGRGAVGCARDRRGDVAGAGALCAGGYRRRSLRCHDTRADRQGSDRRLAPSCRARSSERSDNVQLALGLNSAINAAIATDAFLARVRPIGGVQVSKPLTPAQAAAFLDHEEARWQKLVKDQNIQLE